MVLSKDDFQLEDLYLEQNCHVNENEYYISVYWDKLDGYESIYTIISGEDLQNHHFIYDLLTDERNHLVLSDVKDSLYFLHVYSTDKSYLIKRKAERDYLVYEYFK